jgi:hypothetical protein
MKRRFWIAVTILAAAASGLFIAARYRLYDDFLAPPADQLRWPDEGPEDQPFVTPEPPARFDP